MKKLFLLHLLFILGCSQSVFLVVSLQAPIGTTAPDIDSLEVTVTAEIEGAPVRKVVSFDVTNQSLPVSFFLENEADQKGLVVSLSVLGTKDSIEVLRAIGTGTLGEEIDLTALFCGDLVIQPDTAEACDDGNRINADGCEADCSLPVCGNGIIDPGELCYETPILLPTGNIPVDVELGDIDNDGLLDIAVANSGAGGTLITLFQNQGGGQFVGATTPIVNSPQRALQFADFNNDGRLDLGITTNVDQFVVLQQDATGFFQSHPFTSVIGGTSLVVGEFAKNGGNLVDVAMLPSTIPNSFRFLANTTITAKGAFVDFDLPKTTDLQGGSAIDLLGGDFNQDAQNELDLLAVVFESSQLQLKIFAGNGVGVFSAPVTKTVASSTNRPPTGPNQAASFDIDGDSLLDVVVINPSQNAIEILLGDTTNLFDPSVALALGFVPTSVALADVTGDGAPDLLVTNETQVVLFPGLGGAQFGPSVFIAAGLSPFGPVVGDLNEDGLADIVVVEKGGDKIQILLANP
jgi:cysteine-rich repeat protein